jgi:hypothetical protein|tara:strand:- start:110 stop:286 length:177 start_codon:yes stop_codon:yes gene_type:complete
MLNAEGRIQAKQERLAKDTTWRKKMREANTNMDRTMERHRELVGLVEKMKLLVSGVKT